MAKSKNHTTHNQSRKWHRNGIKKPRSLKYESLKEADPKFLRNMPFGKKYKKKGLKKMQTNNAKAIKALAKAIKPLSTKATKAKLLRSKITKDNAQHTSHKMVTKHLGTRVSTKCRKILKSGSKVSRTANPRGTKSGSKATKYNTKVTKSKLKAAKSNPKAAKVPKSVSKVTKSGPNTTKSGSKANKSTKSGGKINKVRIVTKTNSKATNFDSKVMKSGDSKAVKAAKSINSKSTKAKAAGAKAASPKHSK
ncbi:60S ribosomal protein L29-like [Gracilinanus agilis]|uniref:60S ribosomal protein L29-like n=1 Tax=Gracilinanus agilis TaxID=191870 RepID=UPI001CFEEF2A|nr:60S ribosomal protein L29-like [Gracilinanus agilis]